MRRRIEGRTSFAFHIISYSIELHSHSHKHKTRFGDYVNMLLVCATGTLNCHRNKKPLETLYGRTIYTSVEAFSSVLISRKLFEKSHQNGHVYFMRE